MEIRYHKDPETDLPHIYDHNVTEHEVEEVLRNRGEVRRGKGNSRIAIGQTAAGRYLQVIYVPDEEHEGVFVITAYDLKGKARAAYRRRKRRR